LRPNSFLRLDNSDADSNVKGLKLCCFPNPPLQLVFPELKFIGYCGAVGDDGNYSVLHLPHLSSLRKIVANDLPPLHFQHIFEPLRRSELTNDLLQDVTHWFHSATLQKWRLGSPPFAPEQLPFSLAAAQLTV
jgi:hypothetical protein